MQNYIDYLLYYSASSANILCLTSVCNVGCIFCSHMNNPPEIATHRIPPLTLAKIENLLTYLNPKEKIVIGESVTLIDEGEPFTHPSIVAVLKMIRAKFPRTVIQLTTNGTLLTEDMIRMIKEVGFIEINLSLNSATVEGRKKLMDDRNAQTAINAPVLLSKYGIPYQGSIVGMPQMVGWEDIYYTAQYLNRWGARMIRFFMPGFTRFTPMNRQFPLSFMEQYRNHADFLRNMLTIPIVLEPFMPDSPEAEVIGIIPYSPAQKCGLCTGDIIRTVNGAKVFSRVDAFNKIISNSKCTIEVKREGNAAFVNFVKKAHERPGVVFHYDIDPKLVNKVVNISKSNKFDRAIVLVSDLAYRLWLQVLAHYEAIEVYRVPNIFFAGNIRCAGLLTVYDYQLVLDSINDGTKKTVIMLPAISFDLSGQDLTGKNYTDLDTGGAKTMLL